MFYCLYSHTCPVVEGSPSVLWGVGPAAGERAGAGPAEGGGVSVCPQGNAGQDPGHGEGGLPQAWCTASILFFTSIYICCCSFKTYNPYTPSLEEHISTRWHQRGASSRGADRCEAERGGGSDRPQRAEAAGQRLGRALAGEHMSAHRTMWSTHYLCWTFSSKCKTWRKGDWL